MPVDPNTYGLSIELNLGMSSSLDQLRDAQTLIGNLQNATADIGKIMSGEVATEFGDLNKLFGTMRAELITNVDLGREFKLPTDNVGDYITKMGGALDMAGMMEDGESQREKILSQVGLAQQEIEDRLLNQIKIVEDQLKQHGKLDDFGKEALKKSDEYITYLEDVSEINEELTKFQKEEIKGLRKIIKSQLKITQEVTNQQKALGDMLQTSILAKTGWEDLVKSGFRLGMVIKLLIEPLGKVVALQEEFHGAVYRSIGNVDQMANKTMKLSGNLGATTEEVKGAINALAQVGIGADNIDALSKSTVMFSRVTGVSTEVAGKFAGRMTKLTGTTTLSTRVFGTYSKALRNGTVVTADLEAGMASLQDVAIGLMAIWRDKGVLDKYAASLIKVQQAARGLGMDTGKAEDLLGRLATSAMDFVPILGGDALFATPDENLQSLQDRLPKIERMIAGLPQNVMPEVLGELGLTLDDLALIRQMKKGVVELSAEEQAAADLAAQYKEAQATFTRALQALMIGLQGVVGQLIGPLGTALRLTATAFTIILWPLQKLMEGLEWLSTEMPHVGAVVKAVIAGLIAVQMLRMIGIFGRLASLGKKVVGMFSTVATSAANAGKTLAKTADSGARAAKSMGDGAAAAKTGPAAGAGIKGFFQAIASIKWSTILKFAAMVAIVAITFGILAWALKDVPPATLLAMGVAMVGFGVLLWLASKLMGAAAPELLAFAVAAIAVGAAIAITALGLAVLVMAFTSLITAIGGPMGLVTLGLGFIVMAGGLALFAMAMIPAIPLFPLFAASLMILWGALWWANKQLHKFAVSVAMAGKGLLEMKGASEALWSLKNAFQSLAKVDTGGVIRVGAAMRAMLGGGFTAMGAVMTAMALNMIIEPLTRLAALAGSLDIDLTFMDTLQDANVERLSQVADELERIGSAYMRIGIGSHMITLANVFERMASRPSRTQTVIQSVPSPASRQATAKQHKILDDIRSLISSSNTLLGKIAASTDGSDKGIKDIAEQLRDLDRGGLGAGHRMADYS